MEAEPILVKALEVTRNLPPPICLEAGAVQSVRAEQLLEHPEWLRVVDFMPHAH